MFRFYFREFYSDLKKGFYADKHVLAKLSAISLFALLMTLLQFWIVPTSILGGVVLVYSLWRLVYHPPDEPQKNG